jgi:hypothetical protein
MGNLDVPEILILLGLVGFIAWAFRNWLAHSHSAK